ncbi:MAG: hypothetical protein Q9170_004052 [Blastenia crenularia]
MNLIQTLDSPFASTIKDESASATLGHLARFSFGSQPQDSMAWRWNEELQSPLSVVSKRRPNLQQGTSAFSDESIPTDYVIARRQKPCSDGPWRTKSERVADVEAPNAKDGSRNLRGLFKSETDKHHMDTSSISPSRQTPERIVRTLLTLPNEVLHMVLGYLGKPDLKIARLSCKDLSGLAIPYLFTNIVISIFPTDLEVFTAICSHPCFSKTVTTLFYSVLQFSEECNQEYARHLGCQLEDDLLRTNSELGQMETDEIQKALYCTEFGNFNRLRCHNRPDYSYVFHGGKSAYEDQRCRQMDPSEQAFIRILTEGVSKLSNLTSIVIQNKWTKPTSLDLKKGSNQTSARSILGYGSLARNWNALWLRPEKPRGLQHGTKFFKTLLTILEMTPISLSHMNVGFPLPVYIHCRDDGQHSFSSPMPYGNFIGVSLVSLVLRFEAKFLDTESAIKECNLKEGDLTSFRVGNEKIQRFWQAIPFLRKLEIGPRSPTSVDNDDWRSSDAAKFIFERLFDNDDDIPPLTDLSLLYFEISSARLLRLLRGQCNLRNLSIYEIFITNGTWMEVFNGIADLGLYSFRFNRKPGKSRPDNDCRNLAGQQIYDLDDQVEQWVIEGGENPLKQLGIEQENGYWESIGRH